MKDANPVALTLMGSPKILAFKSLRARLRHTAFMNDRSQVEVLNEERLRSELAMYVWAQSEIMKSQRELGIAEPRDESNYHSSKASLYSEVIKLAGARMTRIELIDKLRALIAEGPNAEIAKLDPAQIASRICHQTK